MFTVLPIGGLCNRMRVVASCAALALANGQPMRVLWHRTPDFNARFDSLFQVQGLPFDVEERIAWTRLGRATFRAREAIAHARGHVVVNDAQAARVATGADQSWAAPSDRHVFVHTNSRLVLVPGMFDVFRPVAAIADAVAGMQARLARSVAVHVRRSDNAQASRGSPLSSFVSLMYEALRADPSLEFFLATDDLETRTTLTQEFGPRLWGYTKRAYARNDPVALADAVIDLYALGSCQRLIGSYWSSFTDTAAELRGIPLKVATGRS